MIDEILCKIDEELHVGIHTERSALYLLAEIRKYLDKCTGEEREKYPNLYFYCNWVLHVEMDRTPAKRILSRFESRIPSSSDLKEISNIIKKYEKNFYSFVDLRRELQGFIEINELQGELVNNGRKWVSFTKLLVKILMDCPLINDGGIVSKFAYESGNDDQIRFRVKIRGKGSIKIKLVEK